MNDTNIRRAGSGSRSTGRMRKWAVLMTALMLMLALLGESGASYAASPQPATGCPILNLTIDESRGTIKAMNSDAKHKTKCYGTMELTIPQEMAEAGGYKAEVTAAMEIKGRGNSTWSMAKKPYQIKLESKENLFGMGKSKTWVLLQNHADKTLIRNKLIYDLAGDMGMPYSCKSELVEVCMNGEYLGTYLLSEKVQIGTNRIEIDDLEDEPDAAELPAISGGYLLEQDREDRAKAEPVWFQSKIGNYFVVKSPETANAAQKSYITAYMNDVEAAITSSNFCNSKGQRYDNLIDLESLVDNLIIQELAKNYDAGGSGTSSMYLFKPRNDVMYMGPVWDFDLAVGNYHIGASQDPSDWLIINTGWFKYLQKDKVFMDALQKKWNEIQGRLNHLYQDEEGQASSITELTSRAGGMNNWDRWTFSEQVVTWCGTPVQKDYPAEVEKLRFFVKNRVAWINSHMAAKASAANKTAAIGGTVGISAADSGLKADLTNLRPLSAWNSLTYQWYRNGQAIEGANSDTYIPESGDVGQRLTVEVKGSGLYNGSKESSAAGTCSLIIHADSEAGTVKGSGEYMAGQTVRLSAVPKAGSRFVQWSAQGIDIADCWSPETTAVMPAGPVDIYAVFETVSTGSFEAALRVKDTEGNSVLYCVPGSVLTARLTAKDTSSAPAGIRMLEDRITIDTKVFEMGDITPSSDKVTVRKLAGSEPDTAEIQLLYYNAEAKGSAEAPLVSIELTVKQDAAFAASLISQRIVGAADGEGNRPELTQIAAEPYKIKIVEEIPSGVEIITPEEGGQTGPHLQTLFRENGGYGTESTLFQLNKLPSEGTSFSYEDENGRRRLYFSSLQDAWVGLIPGKTLTAADIGYGLIETKEKPSIIRYGIVGEGWESRSALSFDDLYYFDKTALVEGTIPGDNAQRALAMDVNGDYYLTPTDLTVMIREWLSR